jgi:DNA-binding response OmpR family regulator
VNRHHNVLAFKNYSRARRKFTIVVLDDDPALVKLAPTILNDAGFRAFGTTEPHEALRLIETQASINLLITDVMMPKATGPEIVRQAQRIRQGRLLVLFMTGGFDGVQFRKTDSVLEKPWSCEELINAVRYVLTEVPQPVEWSGPERRREAA